MYCYRPVANPNLDSSDSNEVDDMQEANEQAGGDGDGTSRKIADVCNPVRTYLIYC